MELSFPTRRYGESEFTVITRVPLDTSQVQARLSTVKETRDTYQKQIEELGISVEEEKGLRLELVRATTMILPKHLVF